MTEQLSLTGDPPIVTAEDGQRLGPAQQAVLEELQRFGRLDDDEAGAILHERRGKHPRDTRCEWCARDGRDVLKSLRGHGLAKEKRGDGWQDPRARARRSDPPTSHDAAESVGDLRESQRAVLACFLEHGPMHDELLQARYGQQPTQSESGLRTRRAELCDRKLLRMTGDAATTKHGRATAIFELTALGYQQAVELSADTTDPLDAIGF